MSPIYTKWGPAYSQLRNKIFVLVFSMKTKLCNIKIYSFIGNTIGSNKALPKSLGCQPHSV